MSEKINIESMRRKVAKKQPEKSIVVLERRLDYVLITIICLIAFNIFVQLGNLGHVFELYIYVTIIVSTVIQILFGFSIAKFREIKTLITERSMTKKDTTIKLDDNEIDKIQNVVDTLVNIDFPTTEPPIPPTD
jgi:hypothetical protein